MDGKNRNATATSPVRRPGLFVTFEGPECAGKSTQSRLLVEALRLAGHDVLQTREPGGCALGEQLRDVLLHFKGDGGLDPTAELLLFSASRAQLTRQVIAPHLAKGGIVVCDRYADSTTAYQGYGRGIDLALIARLHDIATLGMPDLTLLLDLPVEAIAARASGRGAGSDRFEGETLSFHQRVRTGFLAIAAAEPDRVRTFDALQPIADLQAGIMEAVRHALA